MTLRRGKSGEEIERNLVVCGGVMIAVSYYCMHFYAMLEGASEEVDHGLDGSADTTQ